MIFLKKLMIECPSTLNKTKTLKGQDMVQNITKTDTLLMAFTDSLWNVGTSIVGSALLT
jgi:hypothetical protein